MKSTNVNRFKHLLVFIAIFLSGFTCLVYEICWIRKASLIFGVSIFALATVTAVFFAGLAFGSFFFGKYIPKIKKPLKVYAVLEICIGILALLNPLSFELSGKIYSFFYPHIIGNLIIQSSCRFILIAVLLFPISFLMGGTLPLFCDFSINSKKNISSTTGTIYALNTLGAMVGCLVTGFILIPRIGVTESIYTSAFLNILVGIIIYKRYYKFSTQKRLKKSLEIIQKSKLFVSKKTVTIVAVFFSTGFIALANEMLWARFLSLIIQNTVYVYTLTLTIILAGIVLGAFIISRFSDSIRREADFFGYIYLLFAVSSIIIISLPITFWTEFIDKQDLFTQLLIVSLTLLIPSILSGMAYPLVIKLAVKDPDYAGAEIGFLNAFNTAGSIFGSIVAGFLLVPLLGLYKSILLITVLALIIAIVALTVLNKNLRLKEATIPISLTILIIWLLPQFSNTKIPKSFLAKNRVLLECKEGLNSNMVVAKNHLGVKVLEIDRLWQGENIPSHQIMAAHVPMVLHKDPQEILVIGAGTGQTPAAFLKHDPKHLTCIDIENELFKLLEKHFDNGWMKDDRVSCIAEDGRSYLSHIKKNFDIISIEIGQTFRPGCASFYTIDFYKEAKKKLNENGLISQFIPLPFLKKEELQSVIKTFITVFPHTVLWYNNYEFLLIGSNDSLEKLTTERLGVLTSNEKVKESLEFSYWGGADNNLNNINPFIAGFLSDSLGLFKLSENGNVYTDNTPVLEYSVAKNQKYFGQHLANLLDFISDHISEFNTIVDFNIDTATNSKLQWIRKHNLNNIPATDLFKEYMKSANISYLQKAFTYNPNNTAILQNMALYSAQNGDMKKAKKLFMKLLDFEPENLLAYTNIGLIYDRMGVVDSAKYHYSRAIEYAPDNSAEAYNNLGVLFAKNQEFDKAILNISKALAINPSYENARRNLSLVKSKMAEEKIAL